MPERLITCAVTVMQSALLRLFGEEQDERVDTRDAQDGRRIGRPPGNQSADACQPGPGKAPRPHCVLVMIAERNLTIGPAIAS